MWAGSVGHRAKYAMGEEHATLFALDFNHPVRVEARSERLTSDAGAVLLRSLQDRLGFAAWWMGT